MPFGSTGARQRDVRRTHGYHAPEAQMDLEDAKAFVDIVEAKSLSRAARARGVAQSTLGRTVDRLEAGFGVRLLDRSPRALALTAAGERFLVEARSLVAHAAGVERSMRELGRTPRGVVRASLCSGYARHRLLAGARSVRRRARRRAPRHHVRR
jgi:DNA-binding transcriptional LysR family regulator